MAHIFVVLKHGWEGTIMSEAGKIVQELFHVGFDLCEVLPRLPLLHNSQQLDFVVGLENKFLHQSSANLVLNLTNLQILVYDLHAETGQLARQELITILIRERLQLLQCQVVKLHQFHAREWFDVEVGDTSGQLKRALVLHVPLVVEDALPDRLCNLGLSFVCSHRNRIISIGVDEGLSEGALLSGHQGCVFEELNSESSG